MYPEYAEVDGKKYKINTDFRVALKCNEIAQDGSISDFERMLGILYTLFGKDGIKDINKCEKFLEIAVKYLKCGMEYDDDDNSNKEPDIDYIQDEKYIRSSFKFDYGYDPYKMEYLHWWEFLNDLNNLSNSEFGSCCILSRVRQIRNFDLKKISDPKEKKEMAKAKKLVALKKNKKVLNDKQKESARNFYQEFLKK